MRCNATHEVTCDDRTGWPHPTHFAVNETGDRVYRWTDDWPGATPHTDPDPLDELVAVSQEAGLYDDPCPDCERGKVRRGFFDVPCPSCGGSDTRPADTRSVERRHVDAAVDALASEGVPMLDRDRLARAALDAAWRKAPWDMPGARPAVTEEMVEVAVRTYENEMGSKCGRPCAMRLALSAALEAAARARQENRDG